MLLYTFRAAGALNAWWGVPTLQTVLFKQALTCGKHLLNLPLRIGLGVRTKVDGLISYTAESTNPLRFQWLGFHIKDTTMPTFSKEFRDKFQVLIVVMLAVLVGLWCAGLKNTRPIIHFETETFLGFYGNPTGGFWSEVAKFFDPSPTDWDNYQARELGYVFEYIDAQMVILLNKTPFFSYGFRSISQISFAILTSVVLYLIARELFPTFRRTSCLVLAMLFPISTQMLAMQAEYFRCGKTVAAFWTALWILCLIHWLKPIARPPNVFAYMLLGLGAFLSFITDKQAVMIGLWLIGLSLIVAGIRRYQNLTCRHLTYFAISFTAAFCFYLFWDYQLCPYIIGSRSRIPSRSELVLPEFLPQSRSRLVYQRSLERIQVDCPPDSIGVWKYLGRQFYILGACARSIYPRCFVCHKEITGNLCNCQWQFETRLDRSRCVESYAGNGNTYLRVHDYAPLHAA